MDEEREYFLSCSPPPLPASPALGLPSTKIVLISPAGQLLVLWDCNAVTNPASFSIQSLTIGSDTDAFGVVHISGASTAHASS